jgi:hypothetical protein
MAGQPRRRAETTQLGGFTLEEFSPLVTAAVASGATARGIAARLNISKRALYDFMEERPSFLAEYARIRIEAEVRAAGQAKQDAAAVETARARLAHEWAAPPVASQAEPTEEAMETAVAFADEIRRRSREMAHSDAAIPRV